MSPKESKLEDVVKDLLLVVNDLSRRLTQLELNTLHTMRIGLNSISPLERRTLCSNGCCFECDECTRKPGSPTLCPSCLNRRSVCNSRRRTLTDTKYDGDL